LNNTYLTEILRRLTAIDSINPTLVAGGAGEAEISTAVVEEMAALGLETERIEHAPGRFSALAWLRGTGGGRTLMLNAHADTVGLDDMPDGLRPRLESGRLYGRGAQDMKGSLAACMAAMKMLKESRVHLSGDVVLAAVADEEYGSLGSEHLANLRRDGRLKLDGVIVTEPSELQVCTAHKGYVWVEVTVYGRAAHGSRYMDGVDANVRMGRYLVELERLANELLQRRPHALVGPPSVHAAQLSGGTALSVYAARSTLNIERRTIPGESGAQAAAELQAIADRLAAADPTFRAEVRPFFQREPFEAFPDSTLVELTRRAAATALGETRPVMGHTYWMDSALFLATGVDTVVIGPVGGGLHTPDEWVDVESCERLAEILVRTATDYCR
jgi:acetylornithine deacetylase